MAFKPIEKFTNMKSTPLLLVAFYACSCVAALAQNAPVHHDTLYSEILGEKRALQIYFPKNYKPGTTTKFDAIYVLDGEWNTSLTSTVQNFLAYAKFVPQDMLIVGISNPSKDNYNLRGRDFTPTHTEREPLSGGADKFLSFIKSELLPYIETTYPARKEGRTLYGTSLGGLFAIYAFLMEPQLFKSYLTVEPALWVDNYHMAGFAAKKLGELKGLNNTLWISARDGGAFKGMGIHGIDSVLRIHAPSELFWRCIGYPDETHFSAIWKGIYDGLKFSYTGQALEGNILINPLRGIVLKDKPFRLSCYNSLADSLMRYTTDGSSPTPASSRMKNRNQLAFSNSTTLTVRSFSPREEFNHVRSVHFEVGNSWPSQAKPKGVKSGGLLYNYYEGSWDGVPDLKKLKPLRSGLVGKGFDLNNFPAPANFVLALNGYLEITEAGYYIFEMGSHDGTRVYINGKRIIGENNVPNFGERFIMPLEKGFYPIVIEYFHKKDGQRLTPIYLMPDGKDDYQIPLEVLYSR